MKFVVLIVILVAIYPVGQWLRNKTNAQLVLAAAIGFLPFTTLDLNVVSFEQYRGDTRGLELTLLDFAAATLLVSLPPAQRPTPYRWLVGAYIAVCALSTLSAPNPLFATFSVFKLLRMFFLLVVLSRACENPQFPPALLKGLAVGVLYQVVLVLEQRYLYGMMRVSGSLSHPNSLAMSVNIVFPIALAILLAGQGGWLALAVVGGAGLAVILSLSRGAMAMYVLATAMVFAGSAFRRMTVRKAAIAASGALAAALVLLKAMDTIVERFLHAPAASEEARHRFEDAASAMLEDHPWGIGINQFSYVLANHGYAERAEIPPVDKDGIVHNVYWLTAAETGYPGLVTFLLMLAVPLIVALVGAVRFKNDIRGDVLLGCAAGLIVTYIQGKAEWIARQTFMSYLFFILVAVIAALWIQGVAQRKEAAPD